MVFIDLVGNGKRGASLSSISSSLLFADCETVFESGREN